MTDVMTFYDHEENLEIQSSNAIYGQLMASSWCHSLPHGLTIHDFCMIVNGEVHFIGILLASFVAMDVSNNVFRRSSNGHRLRRRDYIGESNPWRVTIRSKSHSWHPLSNTILDPGKWNEFF
ncbi:uncharacterized protein LOC135159832 isoform X3 [Diachasmimorpha longicaudata]